MREERDEPGRRSLAWPLVALGLACAFLAAAIVYVTQLRGPVVPVVQRTEFASPSAPPGSSEEAREQALAIDDLLEESGPSRRRLRPAIEKVLSCSDVDTGIETIEDVTRERTEQVERAGKLSVDALPNGADIKDALVKALRASLRADKSYLRWADRFGAAGCRGRANGDPDYDAGQAASREATSAKAEFVEIWNPIAQEEGLPERTDREI